MRSSSVSGANDPNRMKREHRSITGFLTDGSLLSVCGALSELASTRVRLTDEKGRRVARSDDGQAWSAMPEETDSPEIARAIASGVGAMAHLEEAGLAIAPIVAEGVPIGAIVLDAEPAPTRSPIFEQVERVAMGLAMTAGEFCSDELALRRRHAEQNILYRLSSLLVGTTDLDSTFNIALRSAVELFDADAGIVYTLDETVQNTLTMRASTGLSARLRDCLATLPADEIVDREALDGEVVLVSDLRKEVHALHLEAISEEGFRGMVSFGITYRQKRVGLIRLYARRTLSSDRASIALFRAISEQVAAAVAAAKSLERAREHRALKRQLKLAGDVQRRMLPRTTPVTPGLDFAARYEASYELGGDFYDTLTVRGMTGVVIGDVVGKGVPAALLMSSTRAFFRAALRREESIGQAVEHVNRALVRDTLDEEFVTALVMAYDDAARKLHVCSAGHDPPILARRTASGGRGEKRHVTTVTPDGADGMALGIDADQAYRDASIELEPGDVVVACTDGTHEAMNFEGEKFGQARLRRVIADILTERPGATSRDIVDHILWEIRRYTGLARASDDITIVALRVLAGE